MSQNKSLNTLRPWSFQKEAEQSSDVDVSWLWRRRVYSILFSSPFSSPSPIESLLTGMKANPLYIFDKDMSCDFYELKNRRHIVNTCLVLTSLHGNLPHEVMKIIGTEWLINQTFAKLLSQTVHLYSWFINNRSVWLLLPVLMLSNEPNCSLKILTLLELSNYVYSFR